MINRLIFFLFSSLFVASQSVLSIHDSVLTKKKEKKKAHGKIYGLV